MGRGRGETGNMVAALGGLLLLVSLFLDWYKLATFTVTAWTAFEVWDLVLAALALAVIVSAASEMGWWRGPSHAVGLVVLGLAALVIVASQLINPPPSVVNLHPTTGSGGWLALVGAVLMAAGALAAESRVTLSFNSAARPGGGGLGKAAWGRSPRGPARVPVGRPARAPRVPGSAPGLGGRGRARTEYDEDPGYDDPGYGPPPPPPPPPRV